MQQDLKEDPRSDRDVSLADLHRKERTSKKRHRAEDRCQKLDPFLVIGTGEEVEFDDQNIGASGGCRIDENVPARRRAPRSPKGASLYRAISWLAPTPAPKINTAASHGIAISDTFKPPRYLSLGPKISEVTAFRRYARSSCGF
jgi:hypothetical protein